MWILSHSMSFSMNSIEINAKIANKERIDLSFYLEHWTMNSQYSLETNWKTPSDSIKGAYLTTFHGIKLQLENFEDTKESGFIWKDLIGMNFITFHSINANDYITQRGITALWQPFYGMNERMNEWWREQVSKNCVNLMNLLWNSNRTKTPNTLIATLNYKANQKYFLITDSYVHKW